MHDDDGAQILKRRARYVAMALVGVGTATQATACVCLSPLSTDAGDPYLDANIDASRRDAAMTTPDTGHDAASALDASHSDGPSGDGAPSDASTSGDAAETDARDEDAP